MPITKKTDQEQIKYHLHRISNINEEPLLKLQTPTGFENMPIVPLEVAVEPLLRFLPAVDSYAYAAKQRCKNPPADGLTIDESASIMLYSMGWEPLDKCLFVVLNNVLQSEKTEKLAPWYLYLKLFLTALSRLPSVRRNIYRNAKLDINRDYSTGQDFVWRGFSSCTNLFTNLQSKYKSNTSGVRTLFNIKCQSGRDISKHCYHSSEDEILLLPGTKFSVEGCIHEDNDFRIIQVEEIFSSSIFNNLFSDDKKQQTAHINIDRVQPSSDNINTTTSVDQTTPSNQESGESTLGADVGERKKWMQNGVTVAGGNGFGHMLNQLFFPSDFYMDDDDLTIYIADNFNHRIMEWKCGATTGEIVAGGRGEGKELNQLNRPLGVVIDKKTNHLIIADFFNNRVIRWPRRNGTTGEVCIEIKFCARLTIDDNGHLYVASDRDHSVRRWKMNGNDGSTRDNNGYVYFLDTDRHEARPWKMDVNCSTLVAGGNVKGSRVSQLDNPQGIFVDADHSIYISDTENHRVMKWLEGATEGIIVAGGHDEGDSLKQLASPKGVLVDELDNLYVADTLNHRIVCWPKGAKQGYLVLGGNGEGKQSNQLAYPRALSFDREGNLYVVDSANHRIQKFNVDQS